MGTVTLITSITSIVIALISMVYTFIINRNVRILARKQSTLDAFNNLQKDVLDDLVFVTKKNASLIVENIDQKECLEAYNSYRILIARLEHFAVGVNEGIYDFGVVNSLAGEHLIDLYNKVKPIIDHTNIRNSNSKNDTKNYNEFVLLVKRLKEKRNKTTKGKKQ